MLGIFTGTMHKGCDYSRLKHIEEKINGKKIDLYTDGLSIWIQRHGINYNIPPHKIDYKSNILAMVKRGVSQIIGVSVAGSLKKNIEPGKIVVPDDFVRFKDMQTFCDDYICHTIPKLNTDLRNIIFKVAQRERIELIQEGTYIDVRGPSYETNSEIRMFMNYGDIIGMTLGNEATLCSEISIPYASICPISNFGNGLCDEPLSQEIIDKNIKSIIPTVNKLLEALIEELSQK